MCMCVLAESRRQPCTSPYPADECMDNKHNKINKP